MSATHPHHAAPSLTPAEATSLAFWRELGPEFTIEGAGTVPIATLPDAAMLLRLLREEGYVNIPGVLPADCIARLSAGVKRLHERGIPPVFAFVYDDYWRIFRSLAPFLTAILGERYRALPDLWTWYVLPSTSAAGWVPHRDRPVPTLQPDNTPNSLTVWLPLTDATPLNGCMYVLPAAFDPDLHRPGVSAKNEFHFTGENVQNIRALTAPAGSLLAWNQSLVHWGGRASNLGTTPRCSIALQFQRGDLLPFEKPLLDPNVLPSFHDRIGLIAHLIVGFSGFLTLSPDTQVLARALEWKCWRPPAA